VHIRYIRINSYKSQNFIFFGSTRRHLHKNIHKSKKCSSHKNHLKRTKRCLHRNYLKFTTCYLHKNSYKRNKCCLRKNFHNSTSISTNAKHFAQEIPQTHKCRTHNNLYKIIICCLPKNCFKYRQETKFRFEKCIVLVC